ncbi:GGDEF domain-containing protein [Thalassoroseus pseudoceratinae]|uniref:GGDEF domain-containing protein n=1 Tax=Thalassoroseus pseudoceratinae TaxID=2713176 RepID=UPI00141F1B08|nr:GGDEF domain-containing protein [Thalassoroseus pseudoceratinae]
MLVCHAIAVNLSGILERMLDGGFVVVLALICLIQYILHLHYVAQTNREYRTNSEELKTLRDEQRDIQAEHELTRMENRLLCEFVSQSTIRSGLDLILKRFASDDVRDFAALVRIDEPERHVCRHHQLSSESVNRLVFDESLIERLFPGCVLHLTGDELEATRLFQGLATRDQTKVKHLYLIGLGQKSELTGILLTTNLYPADAAKEQQIELASRLAANIAGNVERFYAFEQKEDQYRLTREMLELRNVTDRQYDSPIEMVGAFLAKLCGMVRADAGTVYVEQANREAGGSSEQEPMVRVWGDVPQELRTTYQQVEWELITSYHGRREVLLVNRNDAGENSTIGNAVLAPLIQKNRWVGAFCLSHLGKSSKSFNRHDRELISWSANHLGETLVRVQTIVEMARHANRDSLTDLANRRFFDQAIREMIESAQEEGNEFSLLLCDLDHFKTVNDTYGHQAGDEVLRAVSRILSDQTSRMRAGENAFIARYGGEEMAIILDGVGCSGAKRIAEQIREAISRETIWYRRTPIRITMSIGIASFPTDAVCEESLVAAADSGLYQAKESGRNLVRPPADQWDQPPSVSPPRPTVRKLPIHD